ncbi:hypothetical protein SEA_LARS_63 [Mycobacterium phage Lars]|uniref:Uncharacterized protein n=1 Tax=Mycobacterium phage Lars TaxID=2836022 RepID=A0A8F3E6Q0_9CAUD|nr:hypothetical protein SEA_LARS_63 [Mycobacterium phage Lars]
MSENLVIDNDLFPRYYRARARVRVRARGRGVVGDPHGHGVSLPGSHQPPGRPDGVDRFRRPGDNTAGTPYCR